MDFLINILENKNLTVSEIELIEKSFLLLLMLPVVTTICGFARHIIGLKSLSIYAPIVLTFAFYELGYIEADKKTDIFRGLKFGIVLFIIVFLSTTLIYKFLKRFRMHYIPKTTLVLTGVSISIILSVFLGTFIFERKGLIYLNMFSVIMIATLSDNFISLLARKDLKQTFKIAMQTLFTSIFSYTVIAMPQAKDVAMHYAIPLIIGIILVNIFIGRFLGLRITEYWRFKELIFTDNNDNNNGNSDTNKKK